MGETIINGIIEVSQEVVGQLQYDIGVKGDTGDSGVYHAGQLNVIENTSTLKKSASGSVILIDDVSPVTHDMSVKISSIPNKNLLNRLIAKAHSSDMSVPTEDFINTYCSKKISFKQGITYTFSIKSVSGFSGGDAVWAPDFYIFDNGSLFVANATSPPVVFNTDFFTSDSSENEYVCYDGSALWSKANMIQNLGPWSMTITPVKDFEAAFIVTDGYVTDSVVVTEAQIEVGSTATSYEPYIENPVTDLTAVKVNTYGKNFININSIANDIVKKNPTSCEITNFDGKRCLKIGTTSTIRYTIQTLIPLYGLQLKVYSTGYSASFMGYTKKDTETSVYYISVSAENEWVNITRYYPDASQYYTGIQFYKTDVTKPIYIDLDSVMLEASHTATEYEPYKGSEYTPSADGTVEGVTSIYPSTTLTTDAEGVIIDCEYYKDIDVDDVIERTVTTYTNPKIKIIGDYAFRNCSALTHADFPAATSTGPYSFYDCKSLISVDFPAATIIGSSAFYGCSALTTINFPAITSVGSNAFYGCSALTTINFPAVTSIANFTFNSCSSLTTINFPAVTSIGNNAFYNCKSLISADFPVAKSINNYAFYGCSALTTINFPAVTSIGNNAFYACLALTHADFPAVTSIGAYAFYSCNSLISADFPVAANIGPYSFYGCSALTHADFPVAKSISAYTFYNCKSLISADFPVATNIYSYAFYNCSALTALILRSSTICTLSNKNAFTGCTHITGTGGYIYVPSSLINTYKTATNWVTYASKFRALENYTVDGTTTGALDESKVSA